MRVATGLLVAMLAAPASASGRLDVDCASLRTGSDRLRFLVEQRHAMAARGAGSCASERETHLYARKILARGAAYRHCPQYRRARREAARYERLGRARCSQGDR